MSGQEIQQSNHSQVASIEDIVVEDFDNPLREVDGRMVYAPTNKHTYWLSGYAVDRVMANQNYVVVITGTTGSGKSYGAMALALDIDPDFNVDRIIFRADDFVRIVKSGLPPGSVIMWDEVGVGLSSREWYSIQNKMIAFILETFRRDNLILIMTTPNMEFIDKKVRSLLHGYAETIDPTFTGGKFGWIKYFHIVVNLREGKIMFQYPRIKTPTGKVDILRGKSFLDGNVKFNKPPDWIAKDYEQKKLHFTENLKDTALVALSALDSDGKKKDKFDLRDIIEIISENPKKYGLIVDEDIPQAEVIDRTYVLLTLENPGIRISKTEIGSAIKYLVHLHGGQFKWSKGKALTDADLPNIINLMRVHKKQSLVAKAISCSDTTLTKKIKEWKSLNKWPDDLMKKVDKPTGKKAHPIQKSSATVDEDGGTPDED